MTPCRNSRIRENPEIGATPAERRRLLQTILSRRRALRLICATHEDLTPLLAGASLPLRTFTLGDQSGAPVARLIRQIVEHRLEYFALPGHTPISLPLDAYDYLATRFGSDFRAVDDFLYHVFQQLPHLHHPTLPGGNALAWITLFEQTPLPEP